MASKVAAHHGRLMHSHAHEDLPGTVDLNPEQRATIPATGKPYFPCLLRIQMIRYNGPTSRRQ